MIAKKFETLNPLDKVNLLNKDKSIALYFLRNDFF